MSDQRWQWIEEIFHRAVELAPAARSAYLDEPCGADSSLRREVESLVAHDAQDGAPVAGPAEDAAPRAIAHYRISGKLGEGGMGAVYRAMDTKLGREVAIKVLPPDFAGDPGRMARFTREAKVLASLNHPNIAAIYGVEDRALVMELVEGRELRGPLAADEAIPIARQNRNPGGCLGFGEGRFSDQPIPLRRGLVARRQLDSVRRRKPAFSAASGGWGRTPDHPRHTL